MVQPEELERSLRMGMSKVEEPGTSKEHEQRGVGGAQHDEAAAIRHSTRQQGRANERESDRALGQDSERASESGAQPGAPGKATGERGVTEVKGERDPEREQRIENEQALQVDETRGQQQH